MNTDPTPGLGERISDHNDRRDAEWQQLAADRGTTVDQLQADLQDKDDAQRMERETWAAEREADRSPERES